MHRIRSRFYLVLLVIGLAAALAAMNVGMLTAQSILTDPGSSPTLDVDRLLLETVEPASNGTSSTITVTKTGDTSDGNCDADCSLREALAFATSGATINVPAGTYTLTVGSELTINTSLTLSGDGASTTIIEAATSSSTATHRVFNVGATSTNTTISAVTIRHGKSTLDGGGIINSGVLTLSNSTVTANTATDDGGGVHNSGTLTVTGSTLSSNTAGDGGGAISNEGGTATVTGSTVSSNSAVDGAGIYNIDGGSLTITSSTISGNSSSDDGGGVWNGTLSDQASKPTVIIIKSTLSGNSAVDDGGGMWASDTGTITNTTVSGNSAGDSGGGLRSFGNLTMTSTTVTANTASGQGGGGGGGTAFFRFNSTQTIANSVISGNSSTIGPGCAGDDTIAHAPTSNGYNIIGSTSGCNFTAASTDQTNTDAKLDTLKDNGGSTKTHALLTGSPAIDAGNPATPGSGGNACPSTDQRGTSRPQGTLCDIGAYELAAASAPNASFTATPTSGDARLTVQFTDTSTGGTPTSWSWNFGDGSTSTGQNPTHIFNRGGVFTVTLTATNATGSSTVTRTGLITVTGLVGKIAFYSKRDGNDEIYVMDENGSNQIRLTSNSVIDGSPDWSADGSKITFESNIDGNYEIYAMNADGTGQTRLTTDTAVDQGPAWSPDDSKVAFHRWVSGILREIYVMDADGTNPTNLTNKPSATDEGPAWSPDGNKIVFTCDRDGNVEIYVMNADGSGQTRMTNNSAVDAIANSSPDGSKIAFHSDRDGNYEIYVMNFDGSNQTDLTNNTASDFRPAWSPDGSKITFRSDRDGNSEIYVMNADGSSPTNLTSHSATDGDPDWSPAVYPKVPTGVQRTTPESDSTPTFIWTATPSTTSYEVRVNSGDRSNVGNVTTYTVPDTGALAGGSHTFEVRAIAVTGFAGSAASLAFTVAVQANQTPAAVDDAYTVAEGATLSVTAATGVLLNDTDPGANTLTAVLVTNPTRGALTLSIDGSFTYVHSGGEDTSDSFTYVANDGTGDSNVATVTITVTSVNDPPVASGDAYTVAEGGTLSVTAATGVLDNDTDAEGNSLAAVLVTNVNKGRITLDGDGSFTYVHSGGEDTSDSFTYNANDGTGDSNTATVTIAVTSVNDPPVASGDAYTVAEGGTLVTTAATSVLLNDTDAEGNTLTAVLVTTVANGTLLLTADGTFSYTHNGGETTSDSYTYRANDGTVNSNNVATVTITVTPVNDPPVAVDDSYAVDQGGTLTTTPATGVLSNDTDAENNLLTASVVTSTSQGALTLAPDGSFTYVHNGSALGDSFTYMANDGTTNGNTVTVTITLTGVNRAPAAVDDSYTVAEGGTLSATIATGVLLNDTDADGDTLTAALVNTVTHGTLALNGDGSFSYVHDGGETTSDSFTYKVNDGKVDSGNVATVTITVDPGQRPSRGGQRLLQRGRGRDSDYDRGRRGAPQRHRSGGEQPHRDIRYRCEPWDTGSGRRWLFHLYP